MDVMEEILKNCNSAISGGDEEIITEAPNEDVVVTVSDKEEDDEDLIDFDSIPSESKVIGEKEKKSRKKDVIPRELRYLEFLNPGDGMKIPDGRDLASTQRSKRDYLATGPKSASTSLEDKSTLYHDGHGRLVLASEKVDLCDCLDVSCTGCQWRCSMCNGNKCGPMCRKNRRECIVSVEYSHFHTASVPDRTTINPFIGKK